jgi:thioredoxin-like negative regulator of GroEL
VAVEPEPDGQESAPLGVYTETLARLYWRQGYLDEALRIYRHLADEHPDDPHFQDQIRALNQQREIPSEASPAKPEAALPSARMTATEARQTQHVIGQLERWLNRLQRQRRA